jgi:hypothetical protein
MDFVSADRSRDAEFQADLKNYNFGLAEQNRQITKDVKNTKDKLQKDLGDISSMELEEQIKAGAQQGAELLGATKTFEAIQSGVKKAKGIQQTITDAAGKVKAVQGKVQGALDQASETVGQIKDAASSAQEAAQESLESVKSTVKGSVATAQEAAQEGVGAVKGAVATAQETARGAVATAQEAARGAVATATESAQETLRAGAGAVSQTAGQATQATQEAAATVAERAQSLKPSAEVPSLEGGAAESKTAVTEVTSGLKTTAEGAAEAGSLLSKFGQVGLRGLGGLGALSGMGMAIASDENGGWAKKSLADKIGNVVNIGGAGLDLAGLVLEATPLAPLGLAMQGIGTIAQIGAGVETEISSEVQGGKAAQGLKSQAQGLIDSAPKPQQLLSGVGEAAAGTLGVARQAQF